MKTVVFPTYPWPAGRGRLFGRYSIDMPMSLVKVAGTWTPMAFPHQDILTEGNYYLGGYHYELTDEQAADLPPEYVVTT